jgi:ligand-binding SRPBCC domain-containing protein
VRRIIVETLIHAPRERVFDARTAGLPEPGRTEMLEGRVAGMRTRFTVQVVEMERPLRYVDNASHPAFRMLRHVHEFFAVDGGTLMRDTLEYESRFGAVAGWFLKRFVRRRALALDLEIR